MRDAKDYAIEFGGYLAKAAAAYMDCIGRLSGERPLLDRDGELTDHLRGLNSAIYEFEKRVKRAAAANEYLVWSNEHGAWWRPNSQGYTTLIQAAGRYSREEALKICGLGRDGWRNEGSPDEVPIRLEDAEACSAILAAKATAA